MLAVYLLMLMIKFEVAMAEESEDEEDGGLRTKALLLPGVAAAADCHIS